MSIIQTIFGSHIGLFYDYPYWAVKLRSGGETRPEQWISEVDGRINILNASIRPYDWTKDLIDTSDIMRIEELWMFCPRTPHSPEGNTAHFRFTKDEAGTAFQFNVSKMMVDHRVDHKIIGKVTNRTEGDCTCFIWDGALRVMSAPYKTNVYNFKSWRDGVAPIGKLAHEVVGLRL